MKATKYTGVRFNQLEDGSKVFYIRYKHAGKDVTTKVGSNKEGITPQYCKKLRDQTLVKLRLGEDAPIKSSKTIKTLAEVATEYFDQSEAKSIGKLKSAYNTHLTHLDNTPITSIDDDVVTVLKRKKSKEVSAKTGRVLSVKTVNNILSVLSAILHYARKKNYLQVLPLIEKSKVDNTRERFLSTAEIKTLLEAIENSGLPTTDRLLTFVKVSLVTGGRMGSILGIKGKDIDRTNKTVRLHNHKTGKTYTAFLSNDILTSIQHLEPQQHLIDVSDGKQIQRPLQGILDKLFNKGLKPEDRKERVVVHTLRHTFASHLAIKGTPIQTIMKLMDHSDIKMTLRYAKLMPDAGRDMVEGLYQ